MWKDSRVPTEQMTNEPNPPGRPDGDEPERAPETPTDEPKPAPIQDPPAEPGRPPLVVRGHWTAATARVQL